MLLVITLVAPHREALREAGAGLRQALPAPEAVASLGTGAAEDWIFEQARLPPVESVRAILEALPVDFSWQPLEGRQKRLLLADMDSTIIGCECLDELADFAGKKAEVAAITERAMRGELEFAAALHARVRLLAGLEESALQACFDQRVRLNNGAQCLIATMASLGARCVLVSGGFSFFTQRVAALAGFHAEHSNTLLIANGRLTGEVMEPILGKEAKAQCLARECAALGTHPHEALAIGDGANDEAMIARVGLGLAYQAKPALRALANGRIQYTDLTAALFFQGIAHDRHIHPA